MGPILRCDLTKVKKILNRRSLNDHACCDGFVGSGVDENETAGGAVAFVGVEEEGARWCGCGCARCR